MSVLNIMKSPYFKGKGFNPSPIARGGIPWEADTRLNPKCYGTPAWYSFWRDQVYCINNGIQTGNLFIPGRYYYYLNFNNMTTIEGVITPDMCDLHLEFIKFFEACKANGKNLIVAKKRRAGLSEITHKAIIDYGWRFTYAYKCGIAAGIKTFADELINKWSVSESLLPAELSTKSLIGNKKEIIAGYVHKNQLGDAVEGGTKNQIYIESMFQTGQTFKGLHLNDVIAEECGQFDRLKQFLAATKACLTKGSVQIGTFLFYGTGGEMTKASRDFQEIWSKAEHYNFEKMLITADRFHFPFYGGATMQGVPSENIPNLLVDHKSFEVIGVEDRLAAKQSILEDREKEKKAGDVEKYLTHLKDFPLTEADIFKKTIVNVFDTDTMQNQLDRITLLDSKGTPNYHRCQIDYLKDAKGETVMPLKTIVRIDKETAEDGVVILIHKDHINPIRGHNDIYCAGIDSYDKHLSKTSKSKGAMCVLLRRNSIGGQLQMAPVATICCRPPQREIFYEMCLKLAIHFHLYDESPNSVLIDVANQLIFEHFKQRGYSNALAYRPRKFEAEDSTQQHEFGLHLNNHSKPLMVGLMQTVIYDYGNQIWFPELLNQAQNYDEVSIGSDNDLADAYGFALVQDLSNDVQAANSKEYEDKDVFQLKEWVTDHNGNKVPLGEQVNEMFKEEDIIGDRFLEF